MMIDIGYRAERIRPPFDKASQLIIQFFNLPLICLISIYQ